MQKLRTLQSQLRETVAELTRARFDAEDAGQPAKAEASRLQAEKLTSLSSRIQQVINADLSVNLEKIADGLENAIHDQVAFGLTAAARILAGAVRDLVGREVPIPSASGPFLPQEEDDREPVVGVTVSPGAARNVTGRPGPKKAVIDAIAEAAAKAGLDPLPVLSIVAIESDFRVDAQNPASSAGGLFQFIDGTWKEMGGKPVAGRGGIGNGHAAGAPINEQIRLGLKLTARNRDSLAAMLGRAPEPGELYMAHQQGLGGAKKILRLFSQNPTAPITDAITPDAARLNGMAGMTLAEAREKFRTLMRTHLDEVLDLVEMTEPAPKAAAASGQNAGQVPASASGGLGARAAAAALEEMELFARKGGTIVKETEPPLEAQVLAYFAGVGRGDITRGDQEPWSAAFISFCLREAGATTEILPVKSAAHSDYIHLGLAHRNAGHDVPIVYFDRQETPPRVGDLVGFSRDENVRNRTDIEAKKGKFFASHTDLVLDVRPGKLTVIGGNKSNTIKTETIRLDSDGLIDSDKYFFILRINA